METSGTAKNVTAGPRSVLALFAHAPFRRIWLGTMLGLTGIAMSDAASAWLMTSLDADPRAVSLVQVAAFLPMFMFTLPAGAIVDIIEPRRFLLILQTGLTLLVVGFAAIVWFGLVTPALLLGLTFLLSAGWSVAAPAWAALVPRLVPREDLESASALNSVGYNVSRAIGPAIGGRLIDAIGISIPFWGFAVANACSVLALLSFKPPPQHEAELPAERLTSALRAGVRHAMYNPHLRATLMRTLAIFPFAAAYPTLLPLIARSQMTAGPEFYGLLLAVSSVGAALASFATPLSHRWLNANNVVAVGAAAIAAALVTFGCFPSRPAALGACFIAGAGWTMTLANLSASAQVALPDWVRGRGLATFFTVVFGSMAFSSFAWGHAASEWGLRSTQFLAAAGLIAGIPLSRRWRLHTAEGVDLRPSHHWQAPTLTRDIENDSGPVLVTLRYQLSGENVEPFLDQIEQVGRQRRRDGAYAWGVFADVADRGVFLETFLIGSWLEARYLRERVTMADQEREAELRNLLAEPPRLTLMLAAEAPKAGAEQTHALHVPLFTTSETPA